MKRQDRVRERELTEAVTGPDDAIRPGDFEVSDMEKYAKIERARGLAALQPLVGQTIAAVSATDNYLKIVTSEGQRHCFTGWLDPDEAEKLWD